ncbi:MAG: LacI family DNA-binding transcriptional regulator [Microbacterium sp.]|uniref:LacI family DNA-binding transcriptional regulator n=1 Tax=Microbacterium sp. TaxID=51671 RepID=UPI003D6DE7F1
MKPATIYDVARRAGVSHQTVTRFLRGSSAVREETGKRVEQALRELDYRPNSAARMLRSQQTNRIGVLADRIDANGPVRILNSLSSTAHEHGYVLDFAVTDGTSPGSVSSSLAMLVDHQVAGILATANTDVVLDEISTQDLRVPLVLGTAVAAETGRRSGEFAGALAADHLLELGHRRVGFVAGPEIWLASQDRSRGFRERILAGGGEVVWQRYGDWTPGSGFDAWRSLDTSERDVTGICAANDSMAFGVIAAATDAGVVVPDDLSVIGIDDVAEARYLRPSLTTVTLDFEGEGRSLMEALIARIEGGEEAQASAWSVPALVRRDSTAPVHR